MKKTHIVLAGIIIISLTLVLGLMFLPHQYPQSRSAPSQDPHSQTALKLKGKVKRVEKQNSRELTERKDIDEKDEHETFSFPLLVISILGGLLGLTIILWYGKKRLLSSCKRNSESFSEVTGGQILEQNAPPLRKSIFLKLLFSLIVFCIFLFLPEFGCRLLGLGQEQHQEVASYIANWQNQWGSDFYVLQQSDDNPEINDEGLRDRHHSVRKEPGSIRIVCLGDSITFGYKLDTSQSFPAILEKMVQMKQQTAEVFNVGLPGWSIRQQQIAYERIVRKYGPDYVLLCVCLNDIPETRNNLLAPPPAIFAFLYEHSFFVRWVMRPHEREIHSVEELFSNASEERIKESWGLFFNEVKRLQNTVSADGVHFSLVLFPFRFQVLPDAPPPVPQRLVAEFCHQNDIPFLDGLDVLQRLEMKGFVDHNHLSPEGATAIAQQVLSSEWFSAMRPASRSDVR